MLESSSAIGGVEAEGFERQGRFDEAGIRSGNLHEPDYPPMYDISTLRSADVSSVRISE
jgi:hypothetical protein